MCDSSQGLEHKYQCDQDSILVRIGCLRDVQANASTCWNVKMQVEESRMGALCQKVVKVRKMAVEWQFPHVMCVCVCVLLEPRLDLKLDQPFIDIQYHVQLDPNSIKKERYEYGGLLRRLSSLLLDDYGTWEMIIGHEFSLGVRFRVVTDVTKSAWQP